MESDHIKTCYGRRYDSTRKILELSKRRGRDPELQHPNNENLERECVAVEDLNVSFLS